MTITENLKDHLFQRHLYRTTKVGEEVKNHNSREPRPSLGWKGPWGAPDLPPLEVYVLRQYAAVHSVAAGRRVDNWKLIVSCQINNRHFHLSEPHPGPLLPISLFFTNSPSSREVNISANYKFPPPSSTYHQSRWAFSSSLITVSSSKSHKYVPMAARTFCSLLPSSVPLSMPHH